MNHRKIQNYELLLGSKSPRRRMLMNELGLDYKLVDIDVEEDFPQHLEAEAISLYLCEKKANAYPVETLNEKQILITADTIVWKDNSCIGKPEDEEEAIEMLKKLSGCQHVVYTGICLKTKSAQSSFYAKTLVTFDVLDIDDIIYYVKHHHPFDKAGSYGIQDWIGYIGVSGINGCYYNVMGFPVQKFYKELEKFIENIT